MNNKGTYTVDFKEGTCILFSYPTFIDVLEPEKIEFLNIPKKIELHSAIFKLEAKPNGGTFFIKDTIKTYFNSSALGIGSIKVLYSVTGTNHCITSSETFVEIFEKVVPVPALVVYELITPDNDNQNDYLHIENIEKYPNHEIIIVDRWGKQVFYAKGNYKNNWSPTQLADGAYAYILKTNNDLPAIKGGLFITR